MLDAALGTSTARVRTARIAKDLARALPLPQAFYVTAPLSPPRLWATVVNAALAGFETSLTDGTPPGGATLQRAVSASANSLARLQAALVEPNLSLDAQLVCVMVHADQVHLLISSGMRIYRARGGDPQRLLGKAQRSPGISHGGLLTASEHAVPGDLYVLGSREAFGMRSISAIATALSHSPEAPVADLCDAVLGPCRSEGTGAGLAVVRIR